MVAIRPTTDGFILDYYIDVQRIRQRLRHISLESAEEIRSEVALKIARHRAGVEPYRKKPNKLIQATEQYLSARYDLAPSTKDIHTRALDELQKCYPNASLQSFKGLSTLQRHLRAKYNPRLPIFI